MKDRDERGFTLVELLIVIVVLGVLSGVVVAAVGGIDDRGKNSACRTDKRVVTAAVQAYFAKQKAYPTAIDDATSSTTTLVGSGLLETAPANAGYVITYDAATHSVGPATCPSS